MKEFVAPLIEILHKHTIPYAIGGSVASSYYGEARTTQDIDFSITLDEAVVGLLVRSPMISGGAPSRIGGPQNPMPQVVRT